MTAKGDVALSGTVIAPSENSTFRHSRTTDTSTLASGAERPFFGFAPLHVPQLAPHPRGVFLFMRPWRSSGASKPIPARPVARPVVPAPTPGPLNWHPSLRSCSVPAQRPSMPLQQRSIRVASLHRPAAGRGKLRRSVACSRGSSVRAPPSASALSPALVSSGACIPLLSSPGLIGRSSARSESDPPAYRSYSNPDRWPGSARRLRPTPL
jgi:hypothetical protein